MVKKRVLWIFTPLAILFFSLIIFSDFRGFVFAILRNPTRMGAAAPSSSYLAEKITKYIVSTEERVDKNKPFRILEVGAGTGVFTAQIIKKMGEDDSLDVIEIDAGLCQILRQKFGSNRKVKIYDASILSFDPGYKYDFIVSGLPFNAFDFKFVSDVLKRYKEIIENNGVISYFEYVLVGALRKFFIFGEKKEDLRKNIQVRSDFIKAHGFDRDIIFVNFPPAYVHHLKISK